MELLDTVIALRSHIDPPGEVLPLALPKLEQLDNLGFFYKGYGNANIILPSSIPYFMQPTLQSFPLNLSTEVNCSSPSTPDLEPDRKEIHYIMKFIAHHKDDFLESEKSCPSSIKDCDFITIRGFLSMLMSTPYKPFEDWRLHATRFRGRIYLNKIDTTNQVESDRTQTKKRKRFRKYGQIFKKFCLRKDSTENDDSEYNHIEEDQKLHCMFSMRLQGLKIMFAAQVDGVFRESEVDNQMNTSNNNNRLNNLRLVDLKYSIRPSEYNKAMHYLHKYRHWWCQNFLTGIEDLMVGYRDKNGFVEEIEQLKVSELPTMSEDTWNPSQCVDFLVRMLRMIKDKMNHLDCPNTVYEFYYDPETRKVKYLVYEGRTDHSFLTDEYVSLFE